MIVRKWHTGETKFNVNNVDASKKFTAGVIKLCHYYETYLHVDDGDWPYPGDVVIKYPTDLNNQYVVLEVIPNWIPDISGVDSRMAGRPDLIVVPKGFETLTDKIKEQLDWGEWLLEGEIGKKIDPSKYKFPGVYIKEVDISTTEVKVDVTPEMARDLFTLKDMDYYSILEKETDELRKSISKGMIERLRVLDSDMRIRLLGDL